MLTTLLPTHIEHPYTLCQETNHIVRDCVIRGISDDDIRLDVLGNQNQDMELDTLLSFIKS